jgi:hypothetical protein
MEQEGKIMKIGNLSIILFLLTLTGCSRYSSSFGCGDANGALCMSISKIDKMISSGEIERFTDKNTECKGRHCKQEALSKTSASTFIKTQSQNNIDFVQDMREGK